MHVTGMGSYIKALREGRGMTQVALALKVGTSRAYLSQIESGKVSLANADTRRRLAAELGIRHVDLLVAAGELAPEEVEPLPVSHIHDHRLQGVVAAWPRLKPEVQATMHDWSTKPTFYVDEEPDDIALAR